MKTATHSPLFVTKELFETRYNGADAIFVTGSVIRGEATAHSDLDLVVIYPRVERAYRESFFHKGWPVEAFIHDEQTLKYFFDVVDKNLGRATLAEMVSEGHEMPGPTALTTQLKGMAAATLRDGPATLSDEDSLEYRYHISEILDDMREPRNRQELMASATLLYNELADFFFRTRRSWTGTGKSLVRRMKRVDPIFARAFSDAFEECFANGATPKVIALTEDLLSMHGGLLFDGYRRDVALDWRKN